MVEGKGGGGGEEGVGGWLPRANEHVSSTWLIVTRA